LKTKITLYKNDLKKRILLSGKNILIECSSPAEATNEYRRLKSSLLECGWSARVKKVKEDVDADSDPKLKKVLGYYVLED